MISASDIRDKRFEKAAFGYKQEEIDDFLAMLIENLTKLTLKERICIVKSRYLPIR